MFCFVTVAGVKMLLPVVMVTGLFGLFLGESQAVPLSAMGNELLNSLEDSSDEDMPVIEDDITTHGLERLSSAATCLVAGVEYTHGQQIYRKDPCEFCLCLDGEMFCWWQDCPPTMEGPCRERGPFSPCISIQTNQIASQAAQAAQLAQSASTTLKTTTTKNIPSITTSSKTISSSTSTESSQPATSSKSTNAQTTSRGTSSNNASSFSSDDTGVTGQAENNNTDTTPSAIYTEETEVEYSSEDPNTSTAQGPKHCVVMGKIYQIGDQLPHDTGNCVECICNHGPKVTCSPHQCSPVEVEDLNEYHPPGPRQPIPDVF